MRRKSLILLYLIACALFFASCAKKESELPVAKVDDKIITLGDLKAFEATIPEGLKSQKVGLTAEKDYLESLIAKDLLIIEAEARGLDKSREFIRRLDAEKRRQVIAGFMRNEVYNKVKVSEKEARDLFSRSKLDNEVRVAHISVADEKEAKSIVDQIRKGASFEALAKEKSLDRGTASKGGDFGRYFKKNEAVKGIWDKVFSMKVGQVSDPIKSGNKYEIVKLLDTRPVGFGEVSIQIQEGLRRQKLRNKRAEIIEKYQEKLKIKLNQDGLRLLLKKANNPSGQLPPLSPNERDIAVYNYKGGAITLEDFYDKLQKVSFPPRMVNQSIVEMYTKRFFQSEVLLWEAARQAKIDQDKTIRQWLERKREEMLIEELRKVAFLNKLNISDEEVLKFYETHPYHFQIPGIVTIREVLVNTQEEANDILNRIKKGASIEKLAEKYTMRQPLRLYGGKFKIREFEKPTYGEEFINTAMSAKIGEIKGPIKTKDGYSVFEILERQDTQISPFESSKEQAIALIRDAREDDFFNHQFIPELRSKYASKIKIYEDNLKKASGSIKSKVMTK